MLQFLKVKRGYCVHFASAMAVMARTLDIPARVVVGFLPGTRGANGTWTVSLRDAHAWPELYFQGSAGSGSSRRRRRAPRACRTSSRATRRTVPLPSSSASTSVPDTTPSASANSRLPKEEQVDAGAAGDVTAPSLSQRVMGALTSPWTCRRRAACCLP